MMKRCIIFSSILFILNTQFCLSQEQQPRIIDSICNAINLKIEEGVIQPHTVHFKVNRPAIGMQETNLEFYYNAMSCENWYYDPTTDSTFYTVNPVLYKVVMNYNIAASAFFTKIYYYSEDNLVMLESLLYSGFDVPTTDSLRVYFFAGKAIKIEKFENATIEPAGVEDLDAAAEAVGHSIEYLEFFRQMNALEYNQH